MDQRELLDIKKRYGIIGQNPALDMAIDIALRVAKTDLSVLITGESGVGKDSFSKIIHDNSAYKHGRYLAVNCGSIPEGTIDSELFGHEKGAFTGATEMRKGYFEEADGGTIFLDEVGDLPMSTQVRLLRVLESGEFMRVGSAKTMKTKVRIVAASNCDFAQKIANNKFRLDLYYRLATVPIKVPSLRERKDDIALLFLKYASDMSEKYGMPPVQLTPDALEALRNYAWPGNIRQLKNFTEQVSTIESKRLLNAADLSKYLDQGLSSVPVVVSGGDAKGNPFELNMAYYKMLLDLGTQVAELKQRVKQLSEQINGHSGVSNDKVLPSKNFLPITHHSVQSGNSEQSKADIAWVEPEIMDDPMDIPSVAEDAMPYEKEEETDLSLKKSEKEKIEAALRKHNGNRRKAADELGISDRTLYRRIEEYGLNNGRK